SLWHGNVFKIGRKNCLLVTHNESYYSVFIYGVTKSSMKPIVEPIGAYLQELMHRDGFDPTQVAKMLERAEHVHYAKTSDKKVLGVMNDMVHMLKHYLVSGMIADELELSGRLNHTPYKGKDFAYPVDVLKAML
ncbi:MAG: hypothetical protein L3J47_06760, partial [Sulfurovum sp.]|nr:hypothetical protein [Sulfurovum sp.]